MFFKKSHLPVSEQVSTPGAIQVISPNIDLDATHNNILQHWLTELRSQGVLSLSLSYYVSADANDALHNARLGVGGVGLRRMPGFERGAPMHWEPGKQSREHQNAQAVIVSMIAQNRKALESIGAEAVCDESDRKGSLSIDLSQGPGTFVFTRDVISIKETPQFKTSELDADQVSQILKVVPDNVQEGEPSPCRAVTLNVRLYCKKDVAGDGPTRWQAQILDRVIAVADENGPKLVGNPGGTLERASQSTLSEVLLDVIPLDCVNKEGYLDVTFSLNAQTGCARMDFIKQEHIQDHHEFVWRNVELSRGIQARLERVRSLLAARDATAEPQTDDAPRVSRPRG